MSDEQEPEADQQLSRIDRRREKIRAEIERNREGGHKVPTWVLAVILGLFVVGWILLYVTR